MLSSVLNTCSCNLWLWRWSANKKPVVSDTGYIALMFFSVINFISMPLFACLILNKLCTNCGQKLKQQRDSPPFFKLNLWSWYELIFPQVTFLLTEDPNYTTKNKWGRRKRRRETLSPDRFSLYSSLSSLSGGLTIFTTNSDILDVSSIVEDNTATDKVRQ